MFGELKSRLADANVHSLSRSTESVARLSPQQPLSNLFSPNVLPHQVLAVEPDFCSRPLAWLHLLGPLQAAPVQVYECKDPCRPGTPELWQLHIGLLWIPSGRCMSGFEGGTIPYWVNLVINYGFPQTGTKRKLLDSSSGGPQEQDRRYGG